METKELLILGGLGFLGLNMISTKVSAKTGEVIGETAGNVASGTVMGAIKGITVNPYEWAKNYQGYIPIIDPIAKTLASIKDWRDPYKWLG